MIQLAAKPQFLHIYKSELWIDIYEKMSVFYRRTNGGWPPYPLFFRANVFVRTNIKADIAAQD